MTTRDDLLARREQLVAALAGGAKRVRNRDEEVEYRDIAELERALAVIDRALAARSTVIVVSSHKGL